MPGTHDSFFVTMAGATTTSVSWDNALLREKTRQKRKREGGQHTALSNRLDEHTLHDFPKRALVESTKLEPVYSSFEVMCQDLLKDEATAPPTGGARKCPFHNVLLDYKLSSADWPYYRCPVQACPMFCGANLVENWLAQLPAQLHGSYKEQPTHDLTISLPFVCFCKHELYHGLKLNQSRSAKNPGRFYLACKYRDPEKTTGCKFFQWVNFPLLSSMLQPGKTRLVKPSQPHVFGTRCRRIHSS